MQRGVQEPEEALHDEMDSAAYEARSADQRSASNMPRARSSAARAESEGQTTQSLRAATLASGNKLPTPMHPDCRIPGRERAARGDATDRVDGAAREANQRCPDEQRGRVQQDEEGPRATHPRVEGVAREARRGPDRCARALQRRPRSCKSGTKRREITRKGVPAPRSPSVQPRLGTSSLEHALGIGVVQC